MVFLIILHQRQWPAFCQNNQPKKTFEFPRESKSFRICFKTRKPALKRVFSVLKKLFGVLFRNIRIVSNLNFWNFKS